MNLETINTHTTWAEASNRINQNNAKINESVTRIENATYKNKGYYRTLADLQTSVPSPSVGSKAYVGSSYPYGVYVVENGQWVDSGEAGGEESVNLDHLYMKDDIVWLTQDEFDEMYKEGTLDPTKEYRTYEE